MIFNDINNEDNNIRYEIKSSLVILVLDQVSNFSSLFIL